MQESILILGAGLMQEPAILSAKELGFKVFVIDANPHAQCVSLADEFKQIDLKDKDGIYEYAEKLLNNENLKGIFTAGTDFSASVSFAAEKLGLPCHSYEAALNASIKPRMRSCFEKENVPSPKFFSLSGNELTVSRMFFVTDSLGYPCVVKPADNMGARGCRMIRNIKEVSSSCKIAAQNSRTSTIILEEYMEGPEFSIDALVYNGTMTITGFADRHIYFPPYFIETGHTMPSKASEDVKKQLIKTFAQGVKALGLTCGAAKADIKFTSHGPQIGEIAARLSGGYMSGWTYPYSSEINLTKQAVLIATGKEPSELLEKRIPLEIEGTGFSLYEVPSKKVSAERAWISIPGIVKSIEGSEQAEKVNGIKNIFPRNINPGDKVDFPRNNVQKCGNVISLDENYEKSVENSEKAASRMVVRLEPDNQSTEDFLNGIQSPDESGFPPAAFEKAYEIVSKINLQGIIPESTSILENLEPEIEKLLSLKDRDWNYLTALDSARRFDLFLPDHPDLDKKRFWNAFFKGGLQAAIYVSESSADK